MTVSIPSHNSWVAFKNKYGIPAGAAKGIDMGKEIDKYHNGMSGDFKKNAVLATALEDKFAKYLKTIPEDKVAKGKYGAFKAEFTTDYLLMANRAAEEMATMGGDLGAFSERLRSMLATGLALKPGVDLGTLQKFRQGPVRGTLAAATKVKGFDPKDINLLWKPIDDVINNLGVDADQGTLDKVVHLIEVTVPKTRELATKDGLKV